MPIIDSIGFVEDSVRQSCSSTAEALQRERLGEALAQRRGRARVSVRQLACERLEALEGDLVVGELPGGAQAPLDARAVAEVLSNVVDDVA